MFGTPVTCPWIFHFMSNLLKPTWKKLSGQIRILPLNLPLNGPRAPATPFQSTWNLLGGNQLPKTEWGPKNYKNRMVQSKYRKKIESFLSQAFSIRRAWQDPTRQPKKGGDNIPAHLAATAIVCNGGVIWHTSSKGMPRHAHRRRALMRHVGRRHELHVTVRYGCNFDNDSSRIFWAFDPW